MQIQKVQSNQTIFGTKVKVSPFLIKYICSDERNILKRDLEKLKNNGENDIMFLSFHYNENTLNHFLQADVMEMKSNNSQKIGSAQGTLYQEKKGYCFFDVIDLYKKAKENMYKSQVRMKDWLQYM